MRHDSRRRTYPAARVARPRPEPHPFFSAAKSQSSQPNPADEIKEEGEGNDEN